MLLQLMLCLCIIWLWRYGAPTEGRPSKAVNGTARWHLRDLDHGTIREWGEPIAATYKGA